MSYAALRGLTDMSDGCPKGLVFDSVIGECMVPEPGTTKIDWRTGEEQQPSLFPRKSPTICRGHADCRNYVPCPTCKAMDGHCCTWVHPSTGQIYRECVSTPGVCRMVNDLNTEFRECREQGGKWTDKQECVHDVTGDLLFATATEPVAAPEGRATVTGVGPAPAPESTANGKDNTRLYLFAGAGAALLLAGLYYVGASSE